MKGSFWILLIASLSSVALGCQRTPDSAANPEMPKDSAISLQVETIEEADIHLTEAEAQAPAALEGSHVILPA